MVPYDEIGVIKVLLEFNNMKLLSFQIVRIELTE